MNLYAWNFEPSILIALTLMLVSYVWLTGPYARARDVTPATMLERNRFYLAVVFLFLALVSPIDTLSLVSLSMHMVQHLIMIVVVPPLIILSIPPAVGSLFLRNRSVLALMQAVLNPLVVFLVFNVIFVGWHMPPNYDLAVRDQQVHILEHVMFIVGAFISWWPVFSHQPELPRSTPGFLMLYLFFMSLPPTIIGALLTFA